MFFLIHVLLGAVIGAAIPSLIPVILLAIISHFILDAIPHWDGDFDIKAFARTGKASISRLTFIIRAVDFIIAIALIVFFYTTTHQTIILAGAIASLLPDLVKIGYYTPLKNAKFFQAYLRFHGNLQKETSFVIGILTQIIMIIVCVALYRSLV